MTASARCWAKWAGAIGHSVGVHQGVTEQVLRDFWHEKNVKAGALINGARVMLTGQGVAPSLFAVMVNLGRATVARLKRASPAGAAIFLK